MDLYELILSRRSVRKFRPDPIPEAVLNKTINAARLAPSAANRQPCEFVVVDDPVRRDEIFPLVKWAGYIAPMGDPAPGERPLAYILLLINRNRTRDQARHDAAASAMNIIYTALANGLATCWMGAIDRPSLKRVLDIPNHCEIDSLIALGYPAETPVVEPFLDSIRYWQDEKGVIHVPKRSLADVLHRNRY
jgi:nitroreductase